MADKNKNYTKRYYKKSKKRRKQIKTLSDVAAFNNAYKALQDEGNRNKSESNIAEIKSLSDAVASYTAYEIQQDEGISNKSESNIAEIKSLSDAVAFNNAYKTLQDEENRNKRESYIAEIETLSDAVTYITAYMDSLAQPDEENRNKRMANIGEKEKCNSPVDVTDRINQLAKARAKAKKKQNGARRNSHKPKKPSFLIRVKKGESKVFVPTKKTDISQFCKGKDITFDQFETFFMGNIKSDRDLVRLTKRFYRKNTIEINGFGKSFTFQYGKNKISKEPSPFSIHSKKIIGNAFSIDRAIARNLIVRPMAYQNEVTGTVYKAFRGSRIAYRETKFALKTTAKMAAYATVGTANAGITTFMAGKAIIQAAKEPDKTIQNVKDRIQNLKIDLYDNTDAKNKLIRFKTDVHKNMNDSIDRIKKVQNDMKQAAARLKKMSARKRAEELKKGAGKVFGKIKNTAKELAKKFEHFILQLLKNVITALIGGGLTILLIISPFLLLLLAVLFFVSKDLQVYDCMEDYGAYLKVVAACEEYENRWREEIEVNMIEKFTIPQPDPDCAYENFNTIEVGYTCGSAHDEDAVKGFIIDPEDVYSLICAYYDGDIHNLSAGEDLNEYDPEAPGEEEIMNFVQLILETYYPYDYLESDDFEIVQDYYYCIESYEYDEDGELISKDPVNIVEFIDTFTKPDLLIPEEIVQDEGEGWHTFIETKVTITLHPFTYVLNKLADKEVMDRYRIYRSCFQSYFIPSSDNLEDVPQDFLNQIHYFSYYDKLSLDEFMEASETWPHLQTTRDEFAEMVKTYCNGSIPYSWGGSSFSGSDCSGFVCLMFRTAGYQLSGNTAVLWENSYAIDSTDAMPGDLVFKQAPAMNGINHMGILYDNSDEEACLFMHCASGSGSVINDYNGFVMYRRLPVWFSDDIPSAHEDNYNLN